MIHVHWARYSIPFCKQIGTKMVVEIVQRILMMMAMVLKTV